MMLAWETGCNIRWYSLKTKTDIVPPIATMLTINTRYSKTSLRRSLHTIARTATRPLSTGILHDPANIVSEVPSNLLTWLDIQNDDIRTLDEDFEIKRQDLPYAHNCRTQTSAQEPCKRRCRVLCNPPRLPYLTSIFVGRTDTYV
jgi:hypothetical protein